MFFLYTLGDAERCVNSTTIDTSCVDCTKKKNKKNSKHQLKPWKLFSTTVTDEWNRGDRPYFVIPHLPRTPVCSVPTLLLRPIPLLFQPLCIPVSSVNSLPNPFHEQRRTVCRTADVTGISDVTRLANVSSLHLPFSGLSWPRDTRTMSFPIFPIVYPYIRSYKSLLLSGDVLTCLFHH